MQKSTWEFLVGNKLNVSQKNALEVRKTSNILVSVRSVITSRMREVNLPSALHC